MEDYRQRVFTSYLEKEPLPYKIPTAPKEVKGVAFLRPQVKTVEFHEFPTEHILVLEGDFLWFCHSITLGEGRNACKITTPAQNVTQRSIQFTFAPTDQKKLRGKDGWMQVTLYTHFEVVERRIEVKQVGQRHIAWLCTAVIFICDPFVCRNPMPFPQGRYSWQSIHPVK